MFDKIYKAWEIRRAIDAYDGLRSFRKASKATGIGKSTIHRWWNSFSYISRCCKATRKKTRRRCKYPDLQPMLTQLFASCDVMRFFSLRAVQLSIKEKLGVSPSLSWIHRVLKRSKVSRRRIRDAGVCPRTPADMQQLMASFRQQISSLTNEAIVCIDETGFCNVGNVVQGYFPRGKTPVQAKVPRRQKIRSREVKDMLDSAGIAPLYIPPYSPRCNPIEEFFSELKRSFRSSEKIEFVEKIKDALEKTKPYKNIPSYYNHTRQHVAA